MSDVQSALGWAVDRTNDAIEQLEELGHLDVDERGGSAPFVMETLTLNTRGRVASEGNAEAPAAAQSIAKACGVGDGKTIFVIHGRNLEARDELGKFLSSLGLVPRFFDDVRADMDGTARIADVVDRGMDEAHAVIALFTPDEHCELAERLRRPGHDGPSDAKRWQARPNVLFEAGVAYGKDRSRVLFVVLGSASLFTDASDMLHFRLTNDESERAKLRRTLGGTTVGCVIDETSDAWKRIGDFEACVSRDAPADVVSRPARPRDDPAWLVRDGAYALRVGFLPTASMALTRAWREQRVAVALAAVPGAFRLIDVGDPATGTRVKLPVRYEQGLATAVGEHTQNHTRVRVGVAGSGAVHVSVELPALATVDLDWLLIGMRFAAYFVAEVLAEDPDGDVPAEVEGAYGASLVSVKDMTLSASGFAVAERPHFGRAEERTIDVEPLRWVAGRETNRFVARAVAELAVAFRDSAGGVALDREKLASSVATGAECDAKLS